jgi:hypothetical protein
MLQQRHATRHQRRHSTSLDIMTATRTTQQCHVARWPLTASNTTTASDTQNVNRRPPRQTRTLDDAATAPHRLVRSARYEELAARVDRNRADGYLVRLERAAQLQRRVRRPLCAGGCAVAVGCGAIATAAATTTAVGSTAGRAPAHQHALVRPHCDDDRHFRGKPVDGLEL